ncbi:DUF2703 domain-containing protein [Phosphitispora sp. TUW77]|uniref:DUF2703 domain-containing protein n=1 Tax=Phosphitispora sp. TUW77 TaxID=3152361 RepID=UPI003AB30948
MSDDSKGCCCSGSSCCSPVSEIKSVKRQLVIDFLYLDLSVCAPCQGTNEVLEEAISDVSKVFEATNVEVTINKVNITNEKQAIKYQFESSPTIRINSRDIQLDIRESSCSTCSDLSGVETDCRVWMYQGEEYNVPPKAMIIDAILKEVYGNNTEIAENKIYTVPDNLKRFFKALEQK